MDEDKFSIMNIIGAVVMIGVARLIFGEIGIIGYVVAAAVGAVLGLLVKEMINKIKKRNEPIKESSDQPELIHNEVAATAMTTETENDVVTESSTKPFYYGFGGWLYFYTVCQIYTLYITVIGLKDWYSTIISEDIHSLRAEGYAGLADRFVILGLIGTLASLLVVAAIIVTWIFAYRLSRYYKLTNFIYIIGNSTGVFILIAYMIYLNNYADEELFASKELIGLSTSAAIFLIMWTPYFLKSERVANTFIK